MAFFHSNFLLQTSHQEDVENNHDHRGHPPSYTSSEFHGMASLLGKRSSMPVYPTQIDQETNPTMNNHGEDELSDDGSQIGEKKRRLNMEQVRTLEKNFELGNKLEPERKMQLARALGLQPRQIAIWFQNRRARWKTKKLEKDYDALKRQFELIKAENHTLGAQNKNLISQIEALMKTKEPTESINLNKMDTEGSSSTNNEHDHDTSEIIKLNISTTTTINNNNNNVNSPSLLTHPLFPSSLQLFQNDPARPEKMDHHHHHHHHHNQNQNGIKEENLCNVFCDDQTGFWPWLDQHHFN